MGGGGAGPVGRADGSGRFPGEGTPAAHRLGPRVVDSACPQPGEGRTLELTAQELALGAAGLALLVLGATGATVASRTPGSRGWLLPLRLVPFGVLVGAGAALVRGWDLAVSLAAGAVLVPIVGVAGRWLEVRRGTR